MGRRGVVAAFLLTWMLTIVMGAARGQSSSPPTGQTKSQAIPQSAQPGATADNDIDEPDEPAPSVTAKATPAQSLASAWQMLDDAVKNGKPQVRIDGVSAAETLSGYPAAEGLVSAAMADNDRDVRLAAVVASGTMKDRKLIPALRKALDDKAPAVSYAAAVSLWKMHDSSGKDILYGVLGGERKASAGFLNEQMHDANKDLHSPGTLAMIGAEQGASAFLGPFSIGLDVARMMHHGPSATSARVLTANMIAQDKSSASKRRLIAVLHDKDYFVRGAAARGLGNFHGKDVTGALLPLFEDRKPAVRLIAAAAYIRANGPMRRAVSQSTAKL